ncbi:hypothetical protein Tco_1008213 [Tanacetum coccineum]
MASLEFCDKHNMVVYLEKSEGSEGTNEDRVRGIIATIDRKVKVFVSKASIRRHLKLKDSEGLKTLPTTEMFEQLTLLGFIQIFLKKRKRMLFPYKRTFPTPTLTQKLFSNMKRASKGYSGGDIPLFPTMLTTPESSPSRITSSPSLSPLTHSSTLQPPSNQTTPVTEEAALMPHESPLQSVHSLGHDEGSLSLNELTDLCTSLSKKVKCLESELKQTKQTYNAALTKLIKRVKKLEQIIKTSQAKRRAKVVIFDDEEAEEDPSNQGRSLIEELDLDAGISLLGVFSATTTLADAAKRRQSVENVQTYTKRRREVSTGSGGVSTASRLVSTADISTASRLVSIAGVKAKDKGKAIMHESEPPKKIKKRVQVQMIVDEELAKKVFEEEQARFNADQEARFKVEQEQERINFETALELQKQLDEREEVVAKVDQAHDIDWSDPVVLRYHTLQNRPFFVAEVRKNMCLYLKNQGFYTYGSEIEKEVMKRSGFDLQQESSKPIEEEIVQQNDVIAEQAMKESSRIAGGRRKKSLAKKRARETLSEESAKKQKLEDDTEKEELQVYLNIVLQVYLNIVPEDESLDVESLATKYPIVDWETRILANDKYYYQIKRADGSVKHYKLFSAMLYDFDRQDVLELYKLVKERFQIASLEEKKYHLSQDILSKILSRKLEVDHQSDMGYELISDYDYEIRYHPGKANVVADALSRKEQINPLRVRVTQK